MGSTQSAQIPSEDDDDEEEDEDEENEDPHNLIINNDQIRPLGGGAGAVDGGRSDAGTVIKKVLQTQEPEMLPCHSSASPLSPQLSSLGTPRLGPSIKVWDPFNVLAPPAPPPPHHHFPRSFSPASSPGASALMDEDRAVTDVYLICHGECLMNLRPDLIAGRCPEAALTPNGKRQARALAVFLKSQGVRFNAVYSSPLDRARATALLLCQELNYSEEQIQSSDALVEMSQGHWEGCHRSEIYTAETLSLMERFQPDFSAPSGESLRQVEFRMVQFLNGTVLALPEKFRTDFSPPDQSEVQGFGHRGAGAFTNSVQVQVQVQDGDGAGAGAGLPPPSWDRDRDRDRDRDTLQRHRQGLPRKKSGKSRLQMVTTTGTGDQEADDEMSPRQPMSQDLVREMNVRSGASSTSTTTCVAVFTHSVPIKCVVTGIMGCSAVMSHKICIEESSVTVLQHSWKMGWQIKRLNDTAHLRLL